MAPSDACARLSTSSTAGAETRSQRYRRLIERLLIRDELQDVRPLRLSASQELMWAAVAPLLDEGRPIDVIVLKGRQVYSTTFWQALSFVRTLERAGTLSLIVAHERLTANEILAKARLFAQSLPLPSSLLRLVRDTVSFELPDGTSSIRVTSARRLGKGRGLTLTVMHGSEVAYWENPESLLALRQAMPPHGETIWVLESTANGVAGVGQPFYDEWRAAVDGRSQALPIFIPWYVMPKYQRTPGIPESEWTDEERAVAELAPEHMTPERVAWWRWAVENRCHGSRELFNQEYPATPERAFIASGLPAFDETALLKLRAGVRPPSLTGDFAHGRFVRDARGPVLVWREPEDGHRYVIGVDTAEGLRGGDYSCAQVIDVDRLEQVAMCHGLLGPWETAERVAALGRWYNRALVIVELQGAGISVQDYLIRVHEYPHLHPWRGRQDSIRPSQPRLYGWVTTVATRPLLLEAGRRVINEGLLMLHDAGTLEELSHFSRVDSGKYEATVGHDDRVMALLLALRSREENFTAAAVLQSPQLEEPWMPVRVIEAWTGERRIARHQELIRRARRAARGWLDL